MNKYSTLYIVSAALEEEQRNAAVEKINGVIPANGGTIDKVDLWGTKKLAYPINDMEEGYYVLVYFSSGPELPKELERNMKISEDIIRYMTIREDD